MTMFDLGSVLHILIKFSKSLITCTTMHLLAQKVYGPILLYPNSTSHDSYIRYIGWYINPYLQRISLQLKYVEIP